MDENLSLDENSSSNRYRSLEENRIFDKYRLLDKNRPLDPRFLRQLIPSSWNIKRSCYTCPYLNEKEPSHWVLNLIKVTVIDLEILASFRLWTSVGAEITYGDLIFSQDHDPFANIVIPQEINQAILGQGSSTKADDLDRAADIPSRTSPSPEPIYILPPSASHAPATNSESPSAEGS
ncbi:hypothetical protein LIER_12916 [Lithospermum erythrorhizon]|uniref:Uncharacterized protein n=1 Tax=Lithospermum erythrorhizon TaxID=34254 RepID=A0AAV3PTJ9_LITER